VLGQKKCFEKSVDVVVRKLRTNGKMSVNKKARSRQVGCIIKALKKR
jgi:hypothetical protein